MISGRWPFASPAFSDEPRRDSRTLWRLRVVFVDGSWSFDDVKGRRSLSAIVILAGLVGACAKIPEPPAPVPSLAIESAAFPAPPDLDEPLAVLASPRPLPPRLRWSPTQPVEGDLVVVIVEPEPRGIPVFELRGTAGGRELPLARLGGGSFIGLVAAPLSACATTARVRCPGEEIPIEIEALLGDGSRTSRSLSLRVEPRGFPATRLRVASRYTSPDPSALRRIRREQALIRSTLRTVSEEPLWEGRFIRPIEGPTTSVYGQRRVFNGELRSRHTGLDIDGDTGDPIVAANSGRVAIAQELYFNGNAVFVDHGLGFYTGYFHLSKIEVDEGQWVEKGDIVGLVGATGRVTGPHLHWSVYLLGVPLDPVSLLKPEFFASSQYSAAGIR